MTDTRWTIKGREFVHCNCAYGCPCQFNALPTHGDCRAVAAVDIEEGRHGDTDLAGLRIAMIVSWPGPIHEGRGQVVPIVDERADDAQREALLRIMSGLDTVEGATFFQVFSTTFETVHDPVFAPIELELDVAEPKSVGADRVLNAIAAHALYEGDLIVIDFGTATTFDHVSSTGAYRGGIIAPGINLSMEALHTAAAKLPRVAIQKPKRVVGTDTVGAWDELPATPAGRP